MTAGGPLGTCVRFFKNIFSLRGGIQNPTSPRGNLHPKNTFPMPNLPRNRFRARKLTNATTNATHEERTRHKQSEKWPRAAVCGVLGCVITPHAWATRSWARARLTGTQSTVPHEERGSQIAHGTWYAAALCFSISGAGKQAATCRPPSGGRWLAGGPSRSPTKVHSKLTCTHIFIQMLACNLISTQKKRRARRNIAPTNIRSTKEARDPHQRCTTPGTIHTPGRKPTTQVPFPPTSTSK